MFEIVHGPLGKDGHLFGEVYQIGSFAACLMHSLVDVAFLLLMEWEMLFSRLCSWSVRLCIWRLNSLHARKVIKILAMGTPW